MCFCTLFTSLCVGTALFSRAASSQVFSALVSLTSVFGMGTGGPSPPLAPTFLLRFSPSLYKTGCPVSCHFIHFSLIGDPYEIRTRVAGVRGRSLRPLDQRAGYILSGAPEKRKSVSSTVSGVRRRILLSSGAAFLARMRSRKRNYEWYTFRDSNPGHPD